MAKIKENVYKLNANAIKPLLELNFYPYAITHLPPPIFSDIFPIWQSSVSTLSPQNSSTHTWASHVKNGMTNI